MVNINQVTNREIEAAATLNDLDKACEYIQAAIGQDDGGVAALFFANDAERDWLIASQDERRCWLVEYLEVEALYAEQEPRIYPCLAIDPDPEFHEQLLRNTPKA